MLLSIKVDSGIGMLCINKNIQDILQFPLLEKRRVKLPNGQIVMCEVVSNVEVKFKNRQSLCSAIVLPENEEPILGRRPLFEMDVLIDPQNLELIVNPIHPDHAMVKI